MNVARKSTTKLPQKWPQGQKHESREDEADSGVASTDSTDSFQDALLNLKALSGSGDMVDSDRSEVKEAQSTSGAQKIQNGNSDDGSSQSKENAEDRDILDQIDDIVNATKITDVKTEHGSEEDDDILIIKDDETKDSGKQPNGISDSKVKHIPAKNPLRIGEKVRSTVHSIMSKLVQSNPDVNSLLSKTKSDESADNGDSRGSSPVPLRHDKGNLFDNFEVSEKESKSLTVDSGTPAHQSRLDKEDEALSEDTARKECEGVNSGQEKCVLEKTSVDSTTTEQPADACDETSDNSGKEGADDDVEPVSTIDTNNLKSESREASSEKTCDSVKKINSSPQNDSVLDNCVDKKDDGCSLDEKNLAKSHCEEKPSSNSSALGSSECKNKVGACKTEPMETSSPESCDKVSSKESECDSSGEDKPENDRKRPLENAQVDAEGSQLPKRSRLDEVIGKLGQRVTFPSDVAGIDNFDYEDSTPGDTDSIEKQSEEVSGSTSDEEEDKSASNPKSDKISLTKQELEALVIATAKAAIEQYQSAEILTLSRRLEELKESQEEWRQKAKNLERQVLDLTVLQQRLEKRKAHTAALKSITTRSIGIGVTEDKLKSISPQKLPGNRTPPVTSPATTLGQPVWAPSSQAGARSLVSETLTTSASSAVTSVTLGAPARNTSVAHLLSQTARMPTVASCAAANRSTVAGRPITVGPRLIDSSTNLAGSQGSSPATTLTRGLPSSTTNPTTSLVLVSSVQGLPAASKAVPTQQAGAATIVTPAGSAQVKVIDLTVEDDPGATKQISKVVGSGGVRAMVPQQVVRQIAPVTQTMSAAPSSAILLSSPAGTQIVSANSIQRPSMLQVVTIANAQSLRPGSILTVMPGQTGSVVRPPAAASTFTTSARDSAPVVMAQQLPAGVTFVRPPTTVLGGNSSVRPSPTPPSAGATTVASTARTPVALATAQPSAAVSATASHQSDLLPQTIAPAPSKRNIHPAPLPESICPKGLAADLKPPPPCPGLKISRVKQGIVLSWNMSIPADCVEIASYQLFAYQETSAAPQTSLWKKVGDVKALPLPMACTLTQFQDGNKYHFAVRAIDVYGRSGAFSEPSYIFLTKAA